MQLLGGKEEDRRDPIEKRKLDGDHGEDLKDEEIKIQIRKIKRRKAAGADEIAEEAWLYSEGKLREKLKEILRRVWKGEGFPEEWREGVIASIHKKGDPDRMENYRGVTLLCTAYKLYAGVLTLRLRAEVKKKCVTRNTSRF